MGVYIVNCISYEGVPKVICFSCGDRHFSEFLVILY
jgi:hypothetical protein